MGQYQTVGSGTQQRQEFKPNAFVTSMAPDTEIPLQYMNAGSQGKGADTYRDSISDMLGKAGGSYMKDSWDASSQPQQQMPQQNSLDTYLKSRRY